MSDSKTSLEGAYETIKNKLLSVGCAVSDPKEIAYGIQFSINKAGLVGVIRIYSSKKKGVTYDFSQVKENNLRALLDVSTSATIPEDSNPTINNLRNEVFIPIIGTDESGKGDYFGPLVTAGVYVNEHTKTILEKYGVRDSKKISDSKIFELADAIKRTCANQYAVIEIAPETYNNLYEKFKSENKNLNTLLAWAHAKAIEEVLHKVDCSHALSDKFADEKFIISKLQEKGKRINLRQEHKAEANIAVAAASVLARARFLEKLKTISSLYKISFSKGASEQVIDQAKKVVKQMGKEALRKVAKLHFKTTESIQL